MLKRPVWDWGSVWHGTNEGSRVISLLSGLCAWEYFEASGRETDGPLTWVDVGGKRRGGGRGGCLILRRGWMWEEREGENR